MTHMEEVNKVRVRLDSDDYHRAIDAHDRGAVVTVKGDLEKEGNLTWLSRAKIESISRGGIDSTRTVVLARPRLVWLGPALTRLPTRRLVA